jgi:beta-galactosidase
MYQSEWTNRPVLHLFPHWNWRQGDTVDVWAYTNCDEVELLLNGQSVGIRKKIGEDLHLMWRLPFAPGTLKAVGRTARKHILTRVIRTAGAPATIDLHADRSVIAADGKDLCFVTVKVLDKEGTPVPQASNLIRFEISGDGKIVGVDNGLQTSDESFKAMHRKAFHGMCLVVVQAGEKPSHIVVKAASEGVAETAIAITSK